LIGKIKASEYFTKEEIERIKWILKVFNGKIVSIRSIMKGA